LAYLFVEIQVLVTAAAYIWRRCVGIVLCHWW